MISEETSLNGQAMTESQLGSHPEIDSVAVAVLRAALRSCETFENLQREHRRTLYCAVHTAMRNTDVVSLLQCH